MNTICLDCIHNTRIVTEKKTDIILHLLAHLEISNVASNYDIDYVKYISDLKGERSSSLYEDLKDIDDENMVYLSFMPAFFKTVDSLFQGLSYLCEPNREMINGFTETELRCLQLLQNVYGNNDPCGLVKFSEIAKSEYDLFYSLYWESRREDYLRGIKQFKKIWESEDNDKVLTFLRKQGLPSISVYLSEGMRRNGRGIRTSDSSVSTVAGIPFSKKEVFISYYIAVHELLHQVIDGITQSILKINGQQRSLNPDDEEYNIHEQIENSVILAQHLLMGKTVNNRTNEYYELVSEIAGMDISNESEFVTHFRVDVRIRNKLESMINQNDNTSINRIQ